MHTARQIIEKSTEYNIKLWLTFIDFRKTLLAISTTAVNKALRNNRVDQRCIDLLNNIDEKASTNQQKKS